MDRRCCALLCSGLAFFYFFTDKRTVYPAISSHQQQDVSSRTVIEDDGHQCTT